MVRGKITIATPPDSNPGDKSGERPHYKMKKSIYWSAGYFEWYKLYFLLQCTFQKQKLVSNKQVSSVQETNFYRCWLCV